MAIQKAYTHPNGTTYASAYHKVQVVELLKRVLESGETEDMAMCRVAIFKDSEARTAGKVAVHEFAFPVRNVYPTSEFDTHMGIDILNQSNVNVMKQAYVYMKTKSDLDGIDYTTGVTDV